MHLANRGDLEQILFNWQVLVHVRGVIDSHTDRQERSLHQHTNLNVATISFASSFREHSDTVGVSPEPTYDR